MEIDEKQIVAGKLRIQRDEMQRKRQADSELPKKLHQAQKEVELKRLGLRSVAVTDHELESLRSKIHLQELKNQRLTEESRCAYSKSIINAGRELLGRMFQKQIVSMCGQLERAEN